MRTQLLVAMVALAGAGSLAGQDRRAEIVSIPASSRYPEVLRTAGIGGTVRLRLTVVPGDSLTSDGIRVLSTAHPGFNNAARQIVSHGEYRSALIMGAPVVDSLEVAVEFRLSGPGAELFDTIAVEGPVMDTLGSWHVAIVPLALRRGNHPVAPALRDTASMAAARFIVREIEPSPGGGAPIVCVSLRTSPGKSPLTPAEWLAVQLPGVAMVHPARCPPTFGSMVFIQGRVLPPGPGPARLSIDTVEGWEGGWLVVRLHLSQSLYDCAVRREAPAVVVKCRFTGGEVY